MSTATGALPERISVSITVDGTTVTGFLHSNAAAASLRAQLPLELSFEDYGNQEKIARDSGRHRHHPVRLVG